RSYAQADQLEKIRADDIASRVQAAAIRNLEESRIGITNLIGSRGISRIDANIMSRFAGKQFALVCHHPFLQVRREPVGIIQNKGSGLLARTTAGELSRANQGGDDRSDRRG